MKPIPSGRLVSTHVVRLATRKRATRQLEQVFKALQGDHTHPFAHEIYRRVHKKLPRISLATVYRNLHSLVEEGKIRSLLLDEQAARYDPETSEHDHFVCERCGRVIDLFLRRGRRKNLTPLAENGYLLPNHQLTVLRECPGRGARGPASPAPRPAGRK